MLKSIAEEWENRRAAYMLTLVIAIAAVPAGNAAWLGLQLANQYAFSDETQNASGSAIKVEASQKKLQTRIQPEATDEIARLQLDLKMQVRRTQAAEERAEFAEEKLKSVEERVKELEEAPTYPGEKRFYRVKKTDPGYNAKTRRYVVSEVEPAYLKLNTDYYFANSDTHFEFLEREGSSVLLVADGLMYRFELGGTYGVLGGKTNRCQFSMRDAGKRGIRIEEACFS